jgi:hypothetical protein
MQQLDALWSETPWSEMVVVKVGSCCCLASRSDILLSSYTMEEIWSWAVSGIRGIA